MPGRTPYEAVESFLEPLREALAVLDGYSKIMVSPHGPARHLGDLFGRVGAARQAIRQVRVVHVEPLLAEHPERRRPTQRNPGRVFGGLNRVRPGLPDGAGEEKQPAARGRT